MEFSQRPCIGVGETITIEDRRVGWSPTPTPALPLARTPANPRRGASVRTAAKGAKPCWTKESQLEQVNRKLRRGYKPSQGVELRHKRRIYEDYLRQFCD